MKLDKILPFKAMQWAVVASAVLLISVVAYTPKAAFALGATDEVPVVGTYALITTFVGQGTQEPAGDGDIVNIGNCDGPSIAVLTIFTTPDGGNGKLVDYYDVKSYQPLTCELNDAATDLATNNADTSLASDTVNKAGIEKAITSSLDGQGWRLINSYVNWRRDEHVPGQERELEKTGQRQPAEGQLHWGWNADDLDFYGVTNSAPYGRFRSIDGGENDPTPDDSVVNRPMHIQFNRLYDQGCDLTDQDVVDKEQNKVICTYTNKDGSETTRTLNQLIQDVENSRDGRFVYQGQASTTAGGTTQIKGGCSIAEPGSGANQMLWALLAIPAFVLLRRRVFAPKS